MSNEHYMCCACGVERPIIAGRKESSTIDGDCWSLELGCGHMAHPMTMDPAEALLLQRALRDVAYLAKREAIAKIIYPEWFEEVRDGRHLLDNYPGQYVGYRQRARDKADAILRVMSDMHD